MRTEGAQIHRATTTILVRRTQKKSALYQQWQRVHIDGEKNGERITKKQSRLKRQIAKSENNKILRSG